MSACSSPVNGDYEAASTEPAMRLTVRKDLFPEDRLSKLASVMSDATTIGDELDDISCVKLETDFEQSIDDIANQKLQVANGLVPSPEKPRHRKHKQHSRRDSERVAALNGCLPSNTKKRKSSPRDTRSHRTLTSNSTIVPSRVKGGKNLNLVSSSECQAEVEDESSEDEVLGYHMKLPLVRQSGKPYSHELSQLSSKKSKSKDFSKERRPHVVMPSSGKPRSMLDICSSRSKKKSKKSESTATYRSQIVDTNTIKIKIRRTNINEKITPPPIAEIAVPKKSKKKKAASPVASESSGEEYDPSRGDTAASMSVAAPKPRHPLPKTRRSNNPKHRDKTIKTEGTRGSGSDRRDLSGPQSPWASTMPEEILVKIFEDVVSSQGTLPAVIRLGRVCKLWHSVSCRPELWRSVDLAMYTHEKFKIDYKLVWLLENRLSQCHTLNLAHWKVSNLPWVLSYIMECSPNLMELGLAGWTRLTAEQLYELVQNLNQLCRIDLSLTSEMGGSGTCLSAASVARITESFGDRLTHITLANNRFTALQQILSSIAAHCPNLEVLDISGARATSHPASVPLEALQKGCPKMRVFRAANAQLVLASATTSQQMEAGGWSQLEELSIAGEAAAERVGVGEYRLGDDALARLVRGATRLRLLDLRGLQRLTDSGLVRVPAWDLQHLFLGGCNVTRQNNSGLELISEKWSHSLLELDLSCATAARALDAAVEALAEATQSRLKILNLCGSSVSLGPVKKVLLRCPRLESVNLSSCRALPRGMKRLYTGRELQNLKDSLDPQKAKIKEENEKSGKDKKDVVTETDSKSEKLDRSDPKSSQEKFSSSVELDTSVKSCVSGDDSSRRTFDANTDDSPDGKTTVVKTSKSNTPKMLSPNVQSKPDSSSTPRSETSKLDMGSPHFSPVSKPDSRVQSSPDVQQDTSKGNSSWNLGQFKTTPTHISEASPLSRPDSRSKIRQCKAIEQCSPTTSQESKLSPENMQNIKQDIKNTNNWNYGNYSPMPRQDSQFSQRSPYSAQPSPAQPSPYSAQPSPYSTQPSPYSSQPSPYSAQPSPDTSQIVKSDLQKSSGQWNTGNYSPMTKHPAPYSPHPGTHTSPDPGLGVKNDSLRSNPNKTPGQYSPMSRQDRLHQSPYSPRSSVESVVYGNKQTRSERHLPSPDGGQTPRVPVPTAAWTMERFGLGGTGPAIDPSLVWGTSYATDPMPAALDGGTPQPQPWSGGLPAFDSAGHEDLRDPWTLGQFRVEPPHQMHNNFIEQSVNFESLSGHIGLQSHLPQSYLDESFSETSRVD